MYITLEMLKEFYSKAKPIDALLFEAKIKPAFLCLFSKCLVLFFFLIYFIFGCAGSSLWPEGSEACGIFFPPLGCKGFSLWSMGSREHGLSSCPVARGILVPWPGIEPPSLALEGGVLTTGPPGESSFSKSLWSLKGTWANNIGGREQVP